MRAVDPWALPASADAEPFVKPLTENPWVLRDRDLGTRARALRQLGVYPAARAGGCPSAGVISAVVPSCPPCFPHKMPFREAAPLSAGAGEGVVKGLGERVGLGSGEPGAGQGEDEGH